MSEEDPVHWVDKAAFVMPVIPPALRIDPILAALLHCMSFLELSGDDAVDPDWAVEAMEHVASYLQRLPGEEIAAIARQLADVSAYARKQGAPSTFVEFIDGFLGAYGVGEA